MSGRSSLFCHGLFLSSSSPPSDWSLRSSSGLVMESLWSSLTLLRELSPRLRALLVSDRQCSELSSRRGVSELSSGVQPPPVRLSLRLCSPSSAKTSLE
ncbi:hypothetical protein FKM82_027658 [Ascaphus truei]